MLIEKYKYYKYKIRYKSSFRYRAAKIWNNLPDVLKSMPYNDFKLKLKNDTDILMTILIGTQAMGKITNKDFTYY